MFKKKHKNKIPVDAVFVYVVDLFGQHNDLQSADGSSSRSTFFGPAFKVHPEKKRTVVIGQP